MEKDKLYIPQGLKVEKEIFQGFSKKEMTRAFIISLIIMSINALIYLFTKNTLRFIIITLSGITASVMITQKDRSNISVFDQVKFMVKFHKSQKYYPYKYLPEWGEDIEK